MAIINKSTTTKESDRDNWITPPWFVHRIEKFMRVKFVLDACATAENRKAFSFISKNRNGLEVDWHEELLVLRQSAAEVPAIWVNPPFSEMDKWIDKIIEEKEKGLVIFMLHPDTPDTAWFQKIEANCFLQLVPTGRINFISPVSGRLKSGVNFPSCVSLFTSWPVVGTPRIRIDHSKPGEES